MRKFSLFLFIFAIATQLLAQVPSEGLIAYYPFNGNANDESGNGNNGVIIGATLTADRRGESISAFSFDGINDGIAVSGFNINPTVFSVSLWFYAYSDGSQTGKDLLFRTNPADKADWCWDVAWYKKNGPSRVYSGVKTSTYSVTDSADSAPKNNWNHIVITWDGSTKKTYVNGVLKRTKNITGTSVDYSNKSGLYFGFNSESDFFNGKIDDIRIYNRVVSLTEINALFNEGETYSLKLLSPAGGEDFVAGANHEIRWTGIGVQGVKIDYSLDSGMTWTNLVSYFNNTGVYVWTTPDSTSYNCLVKISNSANSSMLSISSSVFSIEKYKIKILSPDGDETCGINNTYPITWNSNNVQTINLDYSIDNGASWISIASNQPSNGLFNWVVPNTPSAQALMRITNVESGSVYDISTNNFKIDFITGLHESINKPVSFSLLQNYPNPFNPSTRITFSVLSSTYVEIKIYNILGKEVAVLLSEFLNKGTYEKEFNANNLPSGTYFCTLTSNMGSVTRKMQLLK